MKGIETFTFDFAESSGFSEREQVADFEEAVEKIDREAEAYMEAQRAEGRTIRFTTAVMELSAKRG